jgi:hypothetical protein
MGYRPCTDFWFLARCKYKNGVKRFGGYLGGFPERARVLIGCPISEPLLHVCGGLAKLYPYQRAIGEFDRTMDLDPDCKPDFLKDCRDKEWPIRFIDSTAKLPFESTNCWGGILIDPPYGEVEARQYPPGEEKYPNPNQLVQTAINTLRVGYKVGIIHYLLPKCPKNAKFVACVGICCGFNNRIRCLSVYERVQ